MRVSYVGIILLLCACGGKPSPVALDERVRLPGLSIASTSKGLWLATSNFSTGGKLGRVDLKTGLINRSVLPLANDTQIVADGENGLMLLTRRGGDSVTLLEGTTARPLAHFALPEMSNPQSAARDSSGRVWITAQDSNQVVVLSADVKTKLGQVDLSALRSAEEPGALADLAQIAQLGRDHMVVTAQRLDRRVATWKPKRQSGLALVNITSLQVEKAELVDVTNPIALSTHAGKINLFGAGDLSDPQSEVLGRAAKFNGISFAAESTVDHRGKILAADFPVDDQPATVIAWYPSEFKSCIEIGNVSVHCVGSQPSRGYVFNVVRRLGNFVFASYVGDGAAELWVLELGNSLSLQSVQKLKLDMPIQAMSFGP